MVACSAGYVEPPVLTRTPIGDIVYFGPACPTAYPNCAPYPSDSRFLYLEAYEHTNEPYHFAPTLSIACMRGSLLVMYDGGGPSIVSGDTAVSVTISATQTGHFESDFGSDDLEMIFFNASESAGLIGLMLHAESRRPYVRVVVSGNIDTVVADFDVTGIATNISRLACS